VRGRRLFNKVVCPFLGVQIVNKIPENIPEFALIFSSIQDCPGSTVYLN